MFATKRGHSIFTKFKFSNDREKKYFSCQNVDTLATLTLFVPKTINQPKIPTTLNALKYLSIMIIVWFENGLSRSSSSSR